jgi:hypothetical protein
MRLPPKASRTEGPPRTRSRRINQSREAHRAARPLHSPEGKGRPVAESWPSLQVVADCKRLSAVQALGRAGHGRA